MGMADFETTGKFHFEIEASDVK